MFHLRFSMRSGTTSSDERADLYAAAIDMCAWAEPRGGMAVISQHHADVDGYLPSPIPLAAAVAARTTTMPIMIAALLLPLYEPVKLAEDMAVVDIMSRGRVSYVVGIGYRDEEFDLFGVDRRTRGALVEERIDVLRRLWRGETVAVDGRNAAITPRPFLLDGPLVMYGGGTPAAARRAARLGMVFIAERQDPGLEEIYREEAARAGIEPVGCAIPEAGMPSTVFVADNVDKAWDEVGPYMLREATAYAEWNVDKDNVASISNAISIDELREERGAYQILTPDDAADLARRTPLPLQPLVGGLPPEIAWPYLEAAAAVVAS